MGKKQSLKSKPNQEVKIPLENTPNAVEVPKIEIPSNADQRTKNLAILHPDWSIEQINEFKTKNVAPTGVVVDNKGYLKEQEDLKLKQQYLKEQEDLKLKQQQLKAKQQYPQSIIPKEKNSLARNPTLKFKRTITPLTF